MDEEDLLNNIVNALTGREGIEGKSSKKLKQNFSVTQTLAPADVKVSVKGVGELSFPLSKACVQKLINVSTTAKFGMGVETVLDKNVRNTQMIESKNLKVTINQESLSRITSNMRKALSLPTNSTLTPHLHNMLIYGPGQFFNKHRDSEKLPNMVATLVIVLPSPHVGGDLVIEHAKKEYTFSTENVDEENFKCICFYSDCVHKVNKVKGGYRVALTYNVVLNTGESADTACTNEELKAAVRDYFNTVIVSDRVKKIIFFLNHTYSEHSLGWNLLKGEDCQYASSFRSVARELDLDVYLALAEIHQNWASYDDDDYQAEPDELMETESTLNYWIDVDNVKLPYGEYSTERDEICFVRETHYDIFDPTKEEFSGPTGNEGSTMDFWYKRAAVVLWLKSDLMMIQFELNYDAAMAEICTLISVPGNEERVSELLDKAALLANTDRPKKDDFETFINAALYVKTEKNAQAILSPFRLNVLIPENAQMLTQLQQRYGIDWLIKLISVWQKERSSYSYSPDSSMACEAINSFVLEFLKSGGERALIEVLLNTEVTTFIETLKRRSTVFRVGKAEDLERPRELFKACSAIGNTALQEKLAQYLALQPKLFPKNELVKLYHELQKTLSLESLNLLRTHLEEGIKQELSSQTRDVDDWSLSEDLPCDCEHCILLTNFLRSRTIKSKSWQAERSICRHIVFILKRSEAPIDVTINRKRGSFTMKLVKRPTLHKEAVEKCTQLKVMLQTLQANTVVEKGQSSMENDEEKH